LYFIVNYVGTLAQQLGRLPCWKHNSLITIYYIM